jgi:hypothetical protein
MSTRRKGMNAYCTPIHASKHAWVVSSYLLNSHVWMLFSFYNIKKLELREAKIITLS